MSERFWRAALMVGASTFVLPVWAQEQTPDLVITANKQAQSIQYIGSSVTVITQDEIEKQGAKSLRDVLDGQPGLTISESGGPGGFISYYLRGSESRHTLILIDGVRASDSTTTAGEIDLSIVPPQMIERIEIVRGPQSALYGSDAIGGIINIITKKAKKGPPVWQLRLEGGSYGTYGSRLSVSGATGDTTYALALGQYHTDGFKRYGYRVSRLSSLDTSGSDPFDRLSGTAKVSRRVNDWLTLEVGLDASQSRMQYEKASGANPLEPRQFRGHIATAYQRAIAETGPFRTTLTAFEGQLIRRFSTLDPTNAIYIGLRSGAELQQDVDLKQYGKLTYGTRYEMERAKSDYASASYNSSSDNRQRTTAGYALYQISLMQKLHLSAGGRLDEISTSGSFKTYRLTAAYDLTSSTRLRASYGTGVKAPSLFQLKEAYYGNPDLKAETSSGFDVGIEQTFLAGDARIGVTYFNSRIRNLITADAPDYVYYNTAAAKVSGVEVSGDYNIVPTFARLKLSYTSLDAADATTGLSLYRRPADSGRISVAFTPTRDWTIEPILRLVGNRVDGYYNSTTDTTDRKNLRAYARIDLVADYRLNKNVSVFARGENLTNVKYEDVYNYGTAGRSAYAGVQITW